jgi:hypothetical protein
MFKTSTLAYWCCQAAGWGFVWGILTMNGYISLARDHYVLHTCIPGFLATHLLRTCMHRFAPRTLTPPKEVLYLLLAIILTIGLATALKSLWLYYFVDYNLTWYVVFLIFPADYLLLIIPWILIYWGYRLVIRARAQTVQRRRLEWRLREMQTHAAESEITMENLIDEVNRIVELIDENPARARSEITAFSRLLREGYLV